MPIERTAPPVVPPARPHRGRNHSYAPFLDELVLANGGWLSLPLAEITGSKPHAKQVAIHGAAAARKIHVQTSVQSDRLYVRLLPRESSALQDEAAS